MQLKQLSCFAAIIEAKSFTAAARELFISQPTLSQSIQAFEKELGFRLLTRTSTGVAATELGELVLADAKRVLAAAQEAPELEKAIHIVKKAYGELEEIKI